MRREEIRVKGQINAHWSRWFDGMSISHVADDTVLTGNVAGQAARCGALARLRDLGLSLQSVQFVDPEAGGKEA
jgi:hypothetical protein